MSVFTYMFVEIDDAMLRAFKRALGLVAVAHAVTALVSFVVLGGSELGYEVKDLILRLFDDMSGSAHNQSLDVLFQVGFVGFFLYFILLYRTERLLAYRHRGSSGDSSAYSSTDFSTRRSRNRTGPSFSRSCSDY
jgi:hypothetical protein